MKFFRDHVCLFFILFLFLTSCSTVPITGRTQFNVIPESTMLSLSLQQYDEFINNNELSKDQDQRRLVKGVGKKIQKAVEQYFADRNMSQELDNYQWEFNLIESEDVNAWAMPGGKVVIYTGILPVTKDETGLAVVMGHEIAHAIAKHGNERMSQSLLTQMGGIGLSAALNNQPETTQQLLMQAYGIGTQYGVLLPYSRLQESEADHLGLIFMAMAGYNPQKAVGFWTRMADMKEGEAPPEFMSTHPSDKTRIQKIKELLPEAISYYKKSQ